MFTRHKGVEQFDSCLEKQHCSSRLSTSELESEQKKKVFMF